MAKEQLKELLSTANNKDLSKFRKKMKEILNAKIGKRLAEKEVELSKGLFTDGKKKRI